jgi:glycosyltransferase involved in cell wall biosynthesis
MTDAAPLPHLSVVLPCRNQADHIGRVLETYRGPLSALGRPYELVVVPNACTDDTETIVCGLAQRDPSIRVVVNPAGGWGLSVLTGLAAARGELLCYTNSARTEPDQLRRLVELYRSFPADRAVLAKVRRERRGAPAREIGSFLYNLEGQLLFSLGVGDVNGTPKVFPRSLYERVGLTEAGDLIDLEFLAKAERLGARVVEMPVAGFKRHGGTSSTNLASAWGMYAGAIRLRLALIGFGKSVAPLSPRSGRGAGGEGASEPETSP